MSIAAIARDHIIPIETAQHPADQSATIQSQADRIRELEARITELEEHKTMNDRIVEALRPLCEEVPREALDPVTMEPIKEARVLGCGHTFDFDTLRGISIEKHIRPGGPLDCPICREKTPIDCVYYDQAFGETIEQLIRIERVFKQHVTY